MIFITCMAYLDIAYLAAYVLPRIGVVPFDLGLVRRSIPGPAEQQDRSHCKAPGCPTCDIAQEIPEEAVRMAHDIPPLVGL